VLVHGGAHARWSFEHYARVLSEAGYEVHALDWLNHGDSPRLPEDQFLRRGIDDVAREELRDVWAAHRSSSGTAWALWPGWSTPRAIRSSAWSC
jgi:alpha-beta hydrolase superfamily lysophospholipase